MSNVKGPDVALEKERALEEMVNLYQHTLLKMCYLHLKDRALAEDAVQETFLKAYRSMDSFRQESSIKTWLIKIALNTCRDMNRSGWLRFMDRKYTPDMLPEASIPFEEKDEELVLAVMQLPIKLREVMLLHYYQDLSTVEISHLLGLAQSSVSGRLKRGREKLRTLLERREPHA